MDPLTELDALTNFIQPFTPVDTAIELLNLPAAPYDGMLVFRFLEETPRQVNSWKTEHIRRWQVLYYHSHIAKVVQTSHQIGRAFVHGITIPYTDEAGKMWFTRVQAYNIGQTNKTDSKKDYTLSILETKTGSVQSAAQYDLMQQYIMNLDLPYVMTELTYEQIEGAPLHTLDALEITE